MLLSKTTLNYAKRRGINLEIDAEEGVLHISEDDDDIGEPCCLYDVTETGFKWRGNIYLDTKIIEMLPEVIVGELELRWAIDLLSREMARQIYGVIGNMSDVLAKRR